MKRYAKRVDDNHADIKRAFVFFGWQVEDLSHIGHGVPDLYVEKEQPDLRCMFVEIKDGAKPPSKRKLTGMEVLWQRMLQRAGVAVRVIDSVDAVKELDEEL